MTIATDLVILLSEFRQILIECFNDDELRTLCFDLGVDYEILGGEGKEGKARELVGYFKRRMRLDELERYCRQKRPNAAWPELDRLYAVGPYESKRTAVVAPRVEIGHETSFTSIAEYIGSVPLLHKYFRVTIRNASEIYVKEVVVKLKAIHPIPSVMVQGLLPMTLRFSNRPPDASVDLYR